MIDLPYSLYTAAQCRAIDQAAIQQGAARGIVLMKQAARAALRVARAHWQGQKPMVVLCGGGNNGGDGYVLAALAAASGAWVQVYWVQNPQSLSGDAALAYAFACQEGVLIQAFNTQQPPLLPEGALLIDALLGTGLTGELRPDYAAAIGWLNATGQPILALDVPSGLCATTGAGLGAWVRADACVTFVALKQGLLTGFGPEACGALYFDDLNIAPAFYPQAPLQRTDWARESLGLPERSACAHKGHSGHALVIGGDYGYGGAALMACEAALKVGAGLVSLATHEQHITASLVRQPEVMAKAVRNGLELLPSLARASVVAIGPGLGQSAWSQQLLQAVLAQQKPAVWDADALNLLAELPPPSEPKPQWLLTPHPGEAARLLGWPLARVQANRFEAVQALQQRYGAVVVLKGAGTLIAGPEGVFVANVGNAILASGGTGDVLTGLLAGLMAQGLSPLDAARIGVCLHGAAAEALALQQGLRGWTATDLLPALKGLLNG